MRSNSFKLMTETTFPNSYLQRYELKQQSKDKRALSKSLSKGPATVIMPAQQSNTIGAVVGRLSQRLDGVQVKLTSLVNVVKLLQRYTQTRDDQYQKEKEQLVYKKQGISQSCSTHCSLIQYKVKEFDLLCKQFKEQLKSVEKAKQNLVLADLNFGRDSRVEYAEEGSQNIAKMQDRLRDELNNKMQICVKLINSTAQRGDKSLAEKVNQIAFSLNQLENESRRNKMTLEKDIDSLMALVKENSTAIPHNVSVNTEHQNRSKSPLKSAPKSKSKNSKSDKSLSRGKQNRSVVTIQPPKDASKVRQQQLREALRKKKQHREKLKVKNW